MPAAPSVLTTPTGQMGSFRHHALSSMGGTPKSNHGTPKGTPDSVFISPTTSSRRPRGVLTSTSNVLSYVTENDDAAEKKQRRRSKVLVLQRAYESPGTPQDRRRSNPTSGLTNAQVSDHYANCIKLSTENKINAKNAFGLHLIDYMAEMMREKKGEMTNFQVASCTLDASAKIYAGRVDAIHAETYKIIGGLGHGDKHKGGEDAGDVEGVDGSQGNKKKRKRRNCNTIETNLKNLNCNKIDPGFEVDPFFHKMSAAFDEGGTFGLLMNHLQRHNDDSELMLDSNCTMPAHTDEREEKTTETSLDITDIRDMFTTNGSRFESATICPQFTDFEFTKWDLDGEDTFGNMMNNLASSDQAFDIHAAPEPLVDPMMMQGNEQFSGSPPGAEDDFSDVEDFGDDVYSGAGDPSVFVNGQEARMIRSGCSSTTTIGSGSASQLILQMSLEPTEYSFFNKNALSTWAGPQHWNFKPRAKDPSEVTNDGTSSKKTHAKKEPFRVDYEKELDDKPFTRSRAATTLSKTTIAKYNKTSTVLPEDLHYEPDKLFKLFHKTNYIVKRQLGVSGAEVDDGIGGYDYNNDNDCANFCPNTEGGDYDDDDVSSGMNDFSQPSESSQNQTMGFNNMSVFDATMLQGDKLVAQPHKVNKIDITYAKTAKRMDVKRLKTLMWSHLITPGVEDKENLNESPKKRKPSEDEPDEKDKPSTDDGMFGIKSFTEMYGNLPEHLSKTLANNLSVPIAFTCLLHLANEKCLKITRQENSEDLVIVQDNY